jgi:hypothetical protein
MPQWSARVLTMLELAFPRALLWHGIDASRPGTAKFFEDRRERIDPFYFNVTVTKRAGCFFPGPY